MVKLVHNRKWSLIKTRQELNRSYKEICIPVLEKCRFLLYEVKAAISAEMEAFKKVNILYKEPRVKTLVKKVIKDLKCGRHTSEIQKPEDIVNATIQSQSLERHRSNEDLTKTSIKKCSSDGKLTDSKTDTDDVNNEIKNSERTTTDTFNANPPSKLDQKLNCELEEKWNAEKTENDTTRTEQIDEDKEKKLEQDIALSNIVFKLTEKKMKKVCTENLELMYSILDFVMQENSCDIELLRRAMYCQVGEFIFLFNQK